MAQTTTITMSTAARIWGAHREIEAAGILLANIQAAIRDGEDPTPLDVFGRRRGYQLGVPSGESSHRLFNIDPELACKVIEAHIENQKRELLDASLVAANEMGDTNATPRS